MTGKSFHERTGSFNHASKSEEPRRKGSEHDSQTPAEAAAQAESEGRSRKGSDHFDFESWRRAAQQGWEGTESATRIAARCQSSYFLQREHQHGLGGSGRTRRCTKIARRPPCANGEGASQKSDMNHSYSNSTLCDFITSVGKTASASLTSKTASRRSCSTSVFGMCRC